MTCRLEVEMRAIGTAFTGSPTAYGSYGGNGTLMAVATGVADGSYHWRCRFREGGGAYSAWVSFGGNDESAADLVVAKVAGNAPAIPTADQYKSNGTALTVASVTPATGTTNETVVIIKGTVTDPDGDPVRLQVERRATGTAWSSATHNSSFVASGSEAIVEITRLTAGSYHWRYQAQDSHGNGSGWVVFGGNLDPGDADFIVDLTTTPNTAPAVPTSPGQFTNADVAIATGAEAPSTVRFRATLTDPDSDAVRLQVEIKPAGTPFANALSGETSLVTSGSAASLDIGGIRGGSYHWQYRTVDASGNASAWTSYDINLETEADFFVAAPPAADDDHDSRCGLLGMEAVLLLILTIRRRGRK